MAFSVGVIGLGIMGSRMLSALSHHPQFNITAVWDLDAQRCRQVSLAHPNVRVAKDVEALLQSKIDLVYIATPPATHLDYIERSAAKGKAVFCEKPLAVDVKAAQKAVAQVKGLPNAINFPFANAPAVLTLERHLQQGLHGNAQRLDVRFHFSQWPRTWQQGAAAWLAGQAQGGFLREVFSHFAYLTQRLLGPCRIEDAHLDWPDDPELAESYVVARLTANGIPITVVGGVGGCAPDYNEWTLYGSKRSYRLQDWGLLKVATAQRWFDVLPEVEEPAPLQRQLDALAQTLSGTPSLPTLEDGLRVQQLVEALLTYEG